jgi:hypothetical protein
MLINFMKKLAEELTLGELLSSEIEGGGYLIPLEKDLTIRVSESSFGIYFSCEIALLPKAKRETFYGRLLLANLFGQGTNGAVLGLNEDGNKVLLTHLLELDADYQSLHDALEDMINTVDYWREETVAAAS